MTSPVRVVEECRACGGKDLRPFLDLGAQPPANALLKKEELSLPEQKFPLALCHCVGCELIQLTHLVQPELLFRNYVYFSSVSTTMSKHFAAYANDVAERFVPKDGLVVEMGSNDGVLLKALIGKRRILGVDPARNVAEVARKNGVPTLAEFFNADLAKKIVAEQGQASAVIANNVFAHIHDVGDVMKGVAELLTEDGVFVVEAPWVVPFLAHLEFDTVYHEHLSYLGVRPMSVLFERFGFEVFEVQEQPVHGGSIRVFGRRKRASNGPVHPSVARALEAERKEGTADPARLARFAKDCAALRDDLNRLVNELRAKGLRVVGYACPAKGNVLMNYCQLGPDRLEYLVDATPAKQGLFNPGMHIPIFPPDHLLKDQPDYAILFAWNLSKEILEKESAYRARGGKFIIPVPRAEIL